MRKTIRFQDADWSILGLAVTIAMIGLLEIYSTTAHTALANQFKRQICWVVLSTILAVVVSRVDYHSLVEQVPWLYGLSIVALGGLLIAGPSIAGAKRWLPIAGLTFQVSEVAKLVIIVAVAAYFAERRGQYITWKDFVKLGVLVGLPAVLVALEPDLGTALTFFPIGAAALFFAGIRRRHVVASCLLAALMLPVGWHYVLRPYQRERLISYIYPSRDTRGASYQVTQSKIAIGSGGFWGKGLGNGTQGRLGFVPVSHADFIFAAFAEEQGFIGTLVVLILYLALLLRLLDAADRAGDRAGAFVLVGFTSVLFFQIVVNVGMMIGFFPVTGIPLPLMSHGGSSLIFTFLGLGLAMSVNMRRFVN